jgi:hypothetical protein
MFRCEDYETGAEGLHERFVHRVHSAAIGQADQERYGATPGISQPGSCLCQSPAARSLLPEHPG